MTSRCCAASEVLLTTFDEEELTAAVQRCRERAGGRCDLIIAFISRDWHSHLSDALEILQVYGHCQQIIGCSADGVIGTGEEAENVSGISLIALNLPGADIRITGITQEFLETNPGIDEWHSHCGITPEETNGWIGLTNPATFDGESWLRAWNTAYPGSPVYGGLASGAQRPEDFFLFHNNTVNTSDAIAVSFGGTIAVEGVVSQGCRPFGEPYTITQAKENVVITIASKRAYEVLEEAFDSLENEDKDRAKGNIFAGLATTEYLDDFKRGDFLVRNILGGDPEAGAIALGAFPRVGQTLQFQIRDRDTADEDLRVLAKDLYRHHPEPVAGLLFSCTGRGNHLFGVPDHDAGVVGDVFGHLPLSGFFCNGEIGPVGGTNFLHGYTASTAFLVEMPEGASAEEEPAGS